MNEDIRIHSWPCSYYLDSGKQWVSGRLSLTPVGIKFTADKTGELLVDFPLSGISEIKKESSNLIFSSLTILEKSTKHWFSSLQPSRNVVFNVLEHFWREQLLESRGAGAAGRSSKGKELTGMLAGSQKRLEDTAKVLHYQGEQFDNIIKGLDKIEGDMDVADRLLTELESPSWWPFSGKLWKAPLESKPKEAAEPKSQEGIILRIPVIVTHRTDSNAKPGKLTLFASGLEISDCSGQVLHRFEGRDVDEIRVHSPYEISVRQRFIGKPDTAYRLLSARMPQAIPVLEVQFSRKMQFLEDALGFVGASGKSPQVDLGTSIWQAATGLLGGVVQPGSPGGSREGMDNEQVQLQQHEKVSQEEAKELRQILKKLKGLALETEAELERQDEALDSISSSVDRATLTIDKQNRRMKRLT
ncbi:synaptosomal-associated protein 47 isoform X2 [Empidonax traillii]|uniref:synaptosomal-associated protein 47 isoform X1 n=1 Tax=Empidonax traillii TaxID=164674 RepID=UPI000FFD1E99|nr:synaptosomal-associated protein 47 isoform X1 [Empidonax traillii]XP_027764420.1 synaptosomal-associated protein 47 isoform X2 [Empidonax traillii]XP_027764421.1 synaptosomal-associated protein 47 isoform X2 [Empidonax traillii]XP_027764422.1 synaptosomal-associated protein 47 isoform X2 [Empidonax traillii]